MSVSPRYASLPISVSPPDTSCRRRGKNGKRRQVVANGPPIATRIARSPSSRGRRDRRPHARVRLGRERARNSGRVARAPAGGGPPLLDVEVPHPPLVGSRSAAHLRSEEHT